LRVLIMDPVGSASVLSFSLVGNDTRSHIVMSDVLKCNVG
jgi:hypothetical protein